MNISGLIVFIIGAIIGGVVENFIFHVGDLIISHFDCHDVKSDQWENTCNNYKISYFIAAKVLFPIAGGIGFYAGIKKYLK